MRRLDAFGSFLRDDFDPEACDFDFLVELMPMEPYEPLEAYSGLLEDVGTTLGHEVDLVMDDAVKNPYIRRSIERAKQLVYAA